jgi:hypothetical protein
MDLGNFLTGGACMSLFPDSLLVLQPFAEVFTRPTFSHMRTLVYGTLLAWGRRTVTAALRAIGRGDERHFTRLSSRPQSGRVVSLTPEPHSARTPGDGFSSS